MNTLRAVVGPTPGAGHGESFVWTRKSDASVVAIDSGGAASVGAHAGSFSPTILILSHDDEDHTRGAVSLIAAANGSLDELWVPAEWAILIKQIARTPPSALFASSDDVVSLEEVSDDLAAQLVAGADEFDDEPLSMVVVQQAQSQLVQWTTVTIDPQDGFRMRPSPRRAGGYYGAGSVTTIIRRVTKRADALIEIFEAALANNIRIRFFSIDVGLASGARCWETEGKPGLATMANAAEASHALAVTFPPGLPHAYALTRLTVQNRRALSTVLWSERSTPTGGAIIWSDTDGMWLHTLRGRGFSALTPTLVATSAPHHASGNAAHNEVWVELRSAHPDAVMINAGGRWNQTYNGDYVSWVADRCCTWCRPHTSTYQEVTATSTSAGPMVIQQQCLITH